MVENIPDKADELLRRLQESERELVALRSITGESWLTIALIGDVVSSERRPDQGAVEEELRAMQETLSWRVTAPLRAVRRRM